jgi:hypothetical protein
VAEEVGQVQIVCTGGVRAAQDTLLPTINVQIFLNTNLTSRLYSATSSVGGSEALLLVDEPAPDRAEAVHQHQYWLPCFGELRWRRVDSHPHLRLPS